jgi:hypothetical protein
VGVLGHMVAEPASHSLVSPSHSLTHLQNYIPLQHPYQVSARVLGLGATCRVWHGSRIPCGEDVSYISIAAEWKTGKDLSSAHMMWFRVGREAPKNYH